MNTKGNQRYNETKQKIKGTFLRLLKEKKANQITVTEICRGAQIHRTTFYGHYEDIPSLYQEMVGEMYQEIMGYFVDTDWKNGENGFEKLFRLIEERKEFFRQYFDTVGPYLSQKERLPELLMEHMDALVAEMGYETREELEYHQTFFCNGLVAMIQHWLSRDCRETPEELCAILEREYHTRHDFFQLGRKKMSCVKTVPHSEIPPVSFRFSV